MKSKSLITILIIAIVGALAVRGISCGTFPTHQLIH